MFQQSVKIVGKRGKEKSEAVSFVEFFLVAKPKCWPRVCSRELALHTHTKSKQFPLRVAEIAGLPGRRVSST